MNIVLQYKIPRIYLLAVIFYVSHTTIPALGYYTPAILYAGVIAYLYLFTLVHINNPIRLIGSILPIVSMYLLTLFDTSNLAIKAYQIIQVCLYPLILVYFIGSGDKKSCKLLFWAVLSSYILTAFTTYIGCMTFPGAARQLALSEGLVSADEYASYKRANIGSFSFTYSLLLICPMLIYMVKTGVCKKLVPVFMLIIISIAILKTEYTTAILLMTLCFLLFFMPRKLNKKHIVLLVAVLLLIFILSKMFLGEVLMHMSSYFVDTPTVSTRLHDLGMMLSNGFEAVNGGDIESRSRLYRQSIQAFMKSPLWGSGDGVGGHSLLFDTIGRFGLVGFAAFILTYRQAFVLFFKPYVNRPYYGYMLFCFLLAFILAVLNPKDNLGVMTFTIPLFALYFNYHYEDTLDCKQASRSTAR